MNCERCPHMAAIKAAIRPCAMCDEAHVRNRVEATDYTIAQRKLDDHTPSSSVTALDPDVEDTLRKAMSALFALDDVELLLVKHVMRGGSYASFSKPLHALLKRLRPKEAELDDRKPGFRQLAKTWADSIARKMPQMEAVLRARIEEACG